MNDREPFIYIKQMYMKGFFDLEENCKEKIISEDYWDFIIPLYRDEELKEVNPEMRVFRRWILDIKVYL